MFIDPLYLLLALPAFILGVVAQLLLKYYNSKYSKIKTSSGITGAQAVERIVQAEGLDISLSLTNQKLGDHYDPRSRTVTLSSEVANLPSIASVGVAAHEIGHVVQHQKGSALMSVRNLIVPVVNIGSSLGYIMIFAGIAINAINLAWLGLALFSGTSIFSLLTLPVEIDASRRALKLIQDNQILMPEELYGVKKVLTAAALTYVAATVQSLGTLLYFFLRIQGSRD